MNSVGNEVVVLYPVGICRHFIVDLDTQGYLFFIVQKCFHSPNDDFFLPSESIKRASQDLMEY